MNSPGNDADQWPLNVAAVEDDVPLLEEHGGRRARFEEDGDGEEEEGHHGPFDGDRSVVGHRSHQFSYATRLDAPLQCLIGGTL